MVLSFTDAAMDDLPRLEAWQPTGPSAVHARRLARVEAGTSSYVIAADDGTLVASCEVKWAGNAAPEIDDGVPELNGLQVWPEHLQGRGYGSALLDHLETLVRSRGHRAVGLGVDDANVRAARLYLRRDYAASGMRYIDRYEWVDDEGRTLEAADTCVWLVKQLDGPEPRA